MNKMVDNFKMATLWNCVSVVLSYLVLSILLLMNIKIAHLEYLANIIEKIVNSADKQGKKKKKRKKGGGKKKKEKQIKSVSSGIITCVIN